LKGSIEYTATPPSTELRIGWPHEIERCIAVCMKTLT
jgi:hypothetical protein